MRQTILSISLTACLLAACLLAGCLAEGQTDQTQTCEVDWSKTDPIAFLEMLTRRPNAPCWLSQAPEGWIKEEHVEYLLRQIHSQEPAAPVVSLISSYDPREETSTVGNEAMFLIEGFRKQRYPPGLCSVYHFKSDPDEFRKWWQEQKNDLPHSMKGYELYSWPVAGEWFFTLMTGTNRLKTYEEITSGEDVLSEDGWVKITVSGSDTLKALLGRLPAGEQVIWLDGTWPGMAEGERGDLVFPARNIVDDIEAHCAPLGIELQTVTQH
jgi:hypothetical protein